MHEFLGVHFLKKGHLFAHTPKQMPFLAIFSKKIFKKTDSTKLHAMGTPNKGLELAHIISISWSISFINEGKHN